MGQKKDLLELLDDIEVQCKIKEIVSGGEKVKQQSTFTSIFDRNKDEHDSKTIRKYEENIRQLNDEKEKLNTENSKLINQLKEYKFKLNEEESINQKLLKENAEYKETLSKCKNRMESDAQEIKLLKNSADKYNSENLKLSKELESYRKYDDVEMMYSKYMSLDRTVREGLRNTISGANYMSFIVTVINANSIEKLWEYTRVQLENSDQKTFEILRDVCYWAFDKFNSIYGKYVKLDVNIGDEYDSEIHSRVSGSKPSGEITEVLLNGFRKKTGEITKTVVRI